MNTQSSVAQLGCQGRVLWRGVYSRHVDEATHTCIHMCAHTAHVHTQHACTQHVCTYSTCVCTHNMHALNVYAHKALKHTHVQTQHTSTQHTCTHPTTLYRWWTVGQPSGTRRHILLGCPSPSEVPTVGTTLPPPRLPQRGSVSLIPHLSLCRTVPP